MQKQKPGKWLWISCIAAVASVALIVSLSSRTPAPPEPAPPSAWTLEVQVKFNRVHDGKVFCLVDEKRVKPISMEGSTHINLGGMGPMFAESTFVCPGVDVDSQFRLVEMEEPSAKSGMSEDNELWREGVIRVSSLGAGDIHLNDSFLVNLRREPEGIRCFPYFFEWKPPTVLAEGEESTYYGCVVFSWKPK